MGVQEDIIEDLPPHFCQMSKYIGLNQVSPCPAVGTKSVHHILEFNLFPHFVVKYDVNCLPYDLHISISMEISAPF